MMENKIEIFKNEQFGEIRTVAIDGEPWFVGKDVAIALGYTDVNHAIIDHVDEEDRVNSKTQGQNDPEFGQRGTWLINESGLYSLVLSSKLESAKQFKRWVTSEILPTIRKTGGYVANDNLFISTYLGDDISDDVKQLFKNNLTVLRQKNEIIAQQKKVIEEKDKEIEYKEDIIGGFIDDVSLAEKRQRINQIVRHRVKDKKVLSDRWNLLYAEFEKVFHVNLNLRLNNHASEFKPKLKNRLDVVDRQMNRIPDLYGICCKLFENDVKELMKEWECTIVV